MIFSTINYMLIPIRFAHSTHHLLRVLTLFFSPVVTALAQQYCTPQYNFVDCNTLQRKLYVYNMTLNNRQFSTGCSQAGYAGIVNRTTNGIDDPIVVTSGFGYNMTVSTYEYDSRTYQSYDKQAYYAVWIDYDRNGVFNTYELVRSSNYFSFVLYINSNAAGNYRMRIRTRPSTAIDDPCTLQDFGETEDYLLQVLPPTPSVNTYTYQYPCSNSSVTLSASGCYYGTIQWRDQNNNFVGNNPATIQTAQANSYAATCVMNGTSSIPSSRVYVYPSTVSPPSISSNNYNLTVGQSAALTATGCYGTVNWSTGQTGSSITVSPNQTTNYSATCTAYTGSGYCTSNKSNEVAISVNAPTAPAVSASRSVICPNEAVTLSASNCVGFIKWSTGATGNSITVNPSQRTDYSASCVVNNVEGAKSTVTISVNVATTISSQPVSSAICEGGQVLFSVSANGSGTLTYQWTRDGQSLSDSSANQSQLLIRNATTARQGSYRVLVSGACGTVTSNSVTLQVSSRMNASTTTTAANCYGDANGSINVAVTGGLPDRQYRLKDQGDYKASSIFNNLRAGSYTIQVRDAIGCTTETTTEVRQPSRVDFKLTNPISAKCAGGSDGAVIVAATGGNENFTYSINGGTFRQDGTFLDLKAGTTYVITAKDGNGCQATTSAYIRAPEGILVIATPKPVLCADGSTGSISITAAGGTGSYTYQLDQAAPQLSNLFTNLKSATYTITVKDANGCLGTAPNVSVAQPAPLKVTASSTLVNCRPNSATISLSNTGGTGAIQYQLGTGAFFTDPSFANVGVGNYTINAKDDNGCQAATQVSVKKADTLLAVATTVPAFCCTCTTGSITVNGSGGIGTKQYQFGQQGFQFSNTFQSVAPGRYTVTVRDEAGCETPVNVTVTNATAMTLSLTNLRNVSCAGGRDGGATVQVAGGLKPFTYVWQTQKPADSLGVSNTTSRLPEGGFVVTVTDSNRCSAPVSATLSAQNPLPPKPTITGSGGNLVTNAQSGIQWYAGTELKTGKPVPNATQPTFTPFQSSPYFVVSTVNGCASPASDIFTFVLLASEPGSALSLQVLPNPVSDQLQVEVDLPSRTTLRLQLIDLTGRSLFSVQTAPAIGKQRFAWPLTHVPTGLYILQADAADRRSVQRIIVQ